MAKRRSSRALTPLAAAGALALALVPALPAAAATSEWSQPGDDWWTSATWTGAMPVAGDDVRFNGGPRSTYNIGGDVVYQSFTFVQDHEIANGPNPGRIGIGAGGLTVQDGVAASIHRDMYTNIDQTWVVGAGGELTIPTVIRVENASILTLQVDGTFTIAGNIDGMTTGQVVQTGTGVVVRTGSAGGAIAGGYQLTSGGFQLSSATILGTDFAVTGGTLFGAGSIGNLTQSGGVITGGPDSTSAGTISVGNAQLNGGVLQATRFSGAAVTDTLSVRGTLTGTATRLEIELTDGIPLMNETFTVVQAVGGGVIDPGARLSSPAGVVLQDGDEFVSNGHLFRILYTFGTGGTISVEYLGAAPVVGGLAETGADVGAAVAFGALLLAGGAVLMVRRRDA